MIDKSFDDEENDSALLEQKLLDLIKRQKSLPKAFEMVIDRYFFDLS